MIDDVITCPFCDETISDNKNEIWNHCDHLFSAEDDVIDWGEYNFIDTIDEIIETLLKDGYDTVIAAKEESGWLWKENEEIYPSAGCNFSIKAVNDSFNIEISSISYF